MAEASHSAHHAGMNPWILGGMGVLGAIAVAPYLLPALGIGDAGMVNNTMHFMGSSPDPTALGAGLAGHVQGAISSLPVIGSALTSTAPVSIFGLTIASGALASIATTAILGIGGVMLANWMEKREDPNASGIKWSKVVRYTALATSMLIALPSLLGAISVGVAFLSTMFGTQATNSTILAMHGSLGATNLHMGAGGAASGITALIPHFFSCGAAALPVVGALFANHRSEPTPQVRESLSHGQVSAAPAMAHAH